MNSAKIGWLCIIMGILILTVIPDVCAQYSNDSALINGSNIYLSTGQTWTFYQGYTITLMYINNEGSRGWVQLRLNDTLIRSATVSPGEMLYYNSTVNNTNETVILSLTVSEIYSGEDSHIVAFSQVYQYYNPALEEPTPIPTYCPDNTSNVSNTSVAVSTRPTSTPENGIIFTIVIICLCSILVKKNN